MSRKHTDYREWLKAELNRRQRSNARYSLRAFARDLKLSPALISLVLNGHKRLSVASARQVAQLLNLDTEEQSIFIESVLLTRNQNKRFKLKIDIPINPDFIPTFAATSESLAKRLLAEADGDRSDLYCTITVELTSSSKQR